MPDIPDLIQVQVGKELSWGTAVAPTAILNEVDEATFQPEIDAELHKSKRASLAPGFSASLNKGHATAKLSGRVTYEQIPYFLDSLAGIATPSGAGPYVYTYGGALGAVPTRRSMTVVKGIGSNTHRMLGSVANELTFKIETNKPITYELATVGKLVESGTLASLTASSTNIAHANHCTLYIDAWDGVIGTTAISSTWFSYELKIANNLEPYFGIGNFRPRNVREAAWDVSVKITLEMDATTKAYLDSIVGSDLLKHQVRVKAVDDTRILQLDTAIAYLKAPEVTKDTDGIVTLDFEGVGMYNPTLGNYFAASVTNAVSALP